MSLAQRQAEYAHARDSHGMTVEEFERAQGLPPFSVVPSARRARGAKADGWFMYDAETRADALAEDARQMACLGELGVSEYEIAVLYGVRRQRPPRVRAATARPLGCTPSSKRASRDEENRQMNCLRALGVPVRDIAAIFDCSVITVHRQTLAGRLVRRVTVVGTLAEETRQMTCLRKMGMTLREIAALYGCDNVTVLKRTRDDGAARMRVAA